MMVVITTGTTQQSSELLVMVFTHLLVWPRVTALSMMQPETRTNRGHTQQSLWDLGEGGRDTMELNS